jgi:hypothetical protein
LFSPKASVQTYRVDAPRARRLEITSLTIQDSDQDRNAQADIEHKLGDVSRKRFAGKKRRRE